jgi:hypothetical protein
MTPRHIFRVLSLIVGAFGALLLIATGRVALALGAGGSPDPLGGGSASAFWYQLSFMRLFGVALLGLAALSFWGASQLTTTQQRSLGQTLCGIFALLTLMAVGQQVAVWGAVAGWEVAAVLGVVAAMYGLSGVGHLSKPAA